MSTDAAIGMMDGAYFTSRNEILTFFNTLLNLNLTKIEQTASGAVACQLTEYLFPGSIPMSRVNWAAKSPHEYIGNYKLLQNAFNKNKIQRHVDVDKLIRAKYQDNLEFCQWLKAFFDMTAPMLSGGREGYDPVAVRNKGKGGKTVGTNKGGGVKKAGGSATGASATRSGSSRTVGSSRTSATGGASRPARSTTTTSSSASGSRPASGGSSSSSRISSSKENTANSRVTSSSTRTKSSSSASAMSTAKASKYEEEIRSLKSENTSLKSKSSELEHTSAEMEMTLQTVESERDFYFEKLRGIEVMLQVYKEKEEVEAGSGDVGRVMESIFKVMYATMEDDVVVDDEGNLVGDITMESSISQSAVSDNIAQDNLVVEEEEEEELLTSGMGNIAIEDDDGANDKFSGNEIPPNQYSSDSSDDDEFLTSGLDDDVGYDDPGTKLEVAPSGSEEVEVEYKDPVALVDDDDDFSDEDLLAD